MHKSQAGFDPLLLDDTSYEADTLPTQPSHLDPNFMFMILASLSRVPDLSRAVRNRCSGAEVNHMEEPRFKC